MSKQPLDGLKDADRRTVLRYIGGTGAVAAGTGLGVTALTGSAAAATVDISSSNPDTLESDAGEVDEVFIEPSLSVTWDGMDDVVGKVRVLVEATTGEVDLDPPEIESLEYMPVFRATGYANGTSNESEDESGPGTNGEFHILVRRRRADLGLRRRRRCARLRSRRVQLRRDHGVVPRRHADGRSD